MPLIGPWIPVFDEMKCKEVIKNDVYCEEQLPLFFKQDYFGEKFRINFRINFRMRFG